MATWYPLAKQELVTDHSAPGTLEQRNLVVLHITMGPSDFGHDVAPSALNVIAGFRASVSPKRVSSHFVIDRDGTVFQLMPLEETAWHASEVNSRSVGVETAASADGKYPATGAQYAAAFVLVKWLCDLLKIPCDREHALSHNEASPADGHVKCCTAGLDPDKVVNPDGGSAESV